MFKFAILQQTSNKPFIVLEWPEEVFYEHLVKNTPDGSKKVIEESWTKTIKEFKAQTNRN